MVRNIFSILLGIVAGVTLITCVEMIGTSLYPPPSDLDVDNRAAVAAYIMAMPLGAFLMILAGYVVGAIGGAAVAALIKPDFAVRNGVSIGAVLFFGAAMNFVNLPHPTWFVVVSLCCFLPCAWLGSQMAQYFAKAKRV
jgi:hypothetical protein